MTIADRHPQAGLAPPVDSLERAAWNQWILHLANTVQPAFRLWFYPSDIDASGPMQAIIKGAARARIEAAWVRLDAHLSANGPYLLGRAFSAADLTLLMLMRWSRNMPKPATQWNALRDFASCVKSRPSWKQLCEREKLSEWASGRDATKAPGQTKKAPGECPELSLLDDLMCRRRCCNQRRAYSRWSCRIRTRSPGWKPGFSYWVTVAHWPSSSSTRKRQA